MYQLKSNLRLLGFIAILGLAGVLIFSGCVTNNTKPRSDLQRVWNYGLNKYRKAEYEKAILAFWKVAQWDVFRKYDKVYNYLGDAYFELGKLDSAQMVYRRGVGMFPANAGLYRGLGQIHYVRQESRQAIDEYKRAMALQPDHLPTLERLTELYLRLDQLENAIWIYEKIVKLQPDNSEAREIIKVLQRKILDRRLSLENTLRLLKIDPYNLELLLRAANAYDRIRNCELAMDYYLRYYDIRPDNKTVLVKIAECYKDLGQLSNARSFARAALKLDHNFGEAQILIGQVYEQAVDFCKDEATQINPYYHKLVYRKASEAYKRASKDQAVKGRAQKLLQAISHKLPTKGEDFVYRDLHISDVICYIWIEG